MVELQKINFGCGHKHLSGFINVDNNPNVKEADVVHDLNIFPYPFADSSVNEVIMDHVLEHLDDPIRVIEELYRISADGAMLYIKTPHFSCNWLHPGHKNGISTMLFSYFVHDGDDYYGDCYFEVKKIKLSWLRPANKHSVALNTLSRIINFFANLNIGFCQRVWCYWVGGFEELEFETKVIKK
ncbi:MAG: methyltransferase domain-containing protein [Patescibacteria group bacterium]|jgi:ubiquinone/menaquinone biosynthesis C-methylase UbiE